MDEKEKAAAEAAAQAAADQAKAEAEAAAANVETDKLAAKEEEITKLREERDNYKKVALKRLGKLPGDSDFLDESDKSGLTVEEQVKKTLIERDIAAKEQEKDLEIKRIAKENAELRLALKNRPGSGIGSGSSDTSAEVKDNVFSEAQLVTLREKAKRLNADPEKFIANAKANLAKRK